MTTSMTILNDIMNSKDMITPKYNSQFYQTNNSDKK